MASSALQDPTLEPAVPRKTIVVGYDGSPSARVALERGIDLAPLLGTDLLLVTTWTSPRMVSGLGVRPWSPEDDARCILSDAVFDAFPTGAPSWLRSTVIEGSAARILIEQGHGAEMLVVGSRGHGGFAGLLWGSVSSAVAEHADCPVLVLHG